MILNFFTFRSSSAGTVTVQIKTNKSTKGGLVQRSASVSSDLSRKKVKKNVRLCLEEVPKTIILFIVE